MLAHLYKILGYHFQNDGFVRQALTHRSVGEAHNERLEFLGDSILNLIITDYLYRTFPEKPEGDLSKARATLVKGDTLFHIATQIKLGTYLSLGLGELKTGGSSKKSTLANAMEAIIAAVYLDGGFEASRKLVLHLFDSYLSSPTLWDMITDYKTALQEYLQKNKRSLPCYTLKQAVQNQHKTLFYVDCSIQGYPNIMEGKGATRREAEQAAARLWFEQFKRSV